MPDAAETLGLKPTEGFLAGLIVAGATVSNLAGGLSGDALAGIYAAALGYCFGVINGSRRRVPSGPY